MRRFEIITMPIAWALLILGALATKGLFVTTDHSICGPWGCAPETGALVAMHLGWLAVIAPPLIYLSLRLKLTNRTIRRLALGLLALGTVGVLGIMGWQWFLWLPQASAWSRDFFWQRCGFVVVTTIDFPILQLIATALGLMVVSRVRYQLRRAKVTEAIAQNR